ncbi:MAG: diacylglycerol kinase family protein [Cryomorphaceae bacterium]|jgi:diacylglycerol kinase (ATP)|nr:diacylglycerol kinase family protein [Cryomorphaceae bacterium]
MTSFLQSFLFAFKGIKHLLQGRNFKIHLFLFATICIFGVLVSFTLIEWLLVLLTSGCVLAAEGINTAIEELCNLYSTENNTKIARIKDISAGAVLILSAFALIIGLLLLFKYFFTEPGI